jgi:hypothetical protein
VLSKKIQYTTKLHCRKIYNLFVRALETGELFRSEPDNANKIYTDNVRVLCLSYNAKKSKTTAKMSKHSRQNVVMIATLVSSVKFALILLPCLTLILHKSGTRKGLLGPGLNNNEAYFKPFISTMYSKTHNCRINNVSCLAWVLKIL